MFPPVHEWGHVLIAWAIGEEVVSMNLLSVGIQHITSLDWLHGVWQYSPFITLVCCCVWAYLSWFNLNYVVRVYRSKRAIV